MEIKQLSAHGYSLSNILDESILNELTTLVDSFIPLFREVTHDGPGFPKAMPDSDREVYCLDNDLEVKIKNYLFDLNFFSNKDTTSNIQLWRDYPGYRQLLHRDQNEINNILVIYLGGVGNPELGTVYYENDVEYIVEYKKNNGIYLLNSDQILHGLKGTVAGVDYRRTMYINWVKS
jgi:hypothetical protein